MEVVISRVGVVSPWGRGRESFVKGFLQRDNVLREQPSLAVLPSSLAGVADGVSFRPYLRRKKAAKLMTSAARLAMDAAGQVMEGYAGDRQDLGLFLAVGREPPDEGEAEEALVASIDGSRFSEKLLATRGQDLYPPLLPLKTLPNMILAHISIHLGICGENAAWTGEGIRAFQEGYWAVREGMVSAAVVGASDSLIDLAQARDRLRVGEQNPPGEAAVMFLLEPLASARMASRLPLVKMSPIETSTHYTYLQEWIGDCGVAMPMLHLLSLLGTPSFNWSNFAVVSEVQ